MTSMCGASNEDFCFALQTIIGRLQDSPCSNVGTALANAYAEGMFRLANFVDQPTWASATEFDPFTGEALSVIFDVDHTEWQELVLSAIHEGFNLISGGADDYYGDYPCSIYVTY